MFSFVIRHFWNIGQDQKAPVLSWLYLAMLKKNHITDRLACQVHNAKGVPFFVGAKKYPRVGCPLGY
jgi:hypothetical protein